MKLNIGTKAASAAMVMSLAAGVVNAGPGAMRVANAIWAGDRLFDTIITPTSFVSPPEQSTDTLYNFSMSGLTGQRSVSEAYPGSPYYNGGRWSVRMVLFTPTGLAVHDQDGDGDVDFELTSAAQVLEHRDLGHLQIMDATFYFECPLLP
jgi:hypothetical protein